MSERKPQDVMNVGYAAQARFDRRRQLLLGAAAALIPFGGVTHAAAAPKPLQVGGLPVT